MEKHINTLISEAQSRFWPKVSRGKKSECWPWLAYTDKNGYGTMKVCGVLLKATHASLEISGRHRPASSHALHSCDNPICVNPDHLRWGSNLQNMMERDARKRRTPPKGENNGFAKLTDYDAACIKASTEKVREIAARFGVCKSTIQRIKNGERWQHVTSANPIPAPTA